MYLTVFFGLSITGTASVVGVSATLSSNSGFGSIISSIVIGVGVGVISITGSGLLFISSILFMSWASRFLF
jgi:hypothetical protein